MDLLPFQTTGVAYLKAGTRRLLVDEPGLGKTAQGLMAIPDRVPAIVIAPSGLAGVWKVEAERWRPDLAINVLTEYRAPLPGEIVVLSYGRIPEDFDVPAGTHLLADEVHFVKNPKADRTKRFRRLRSKVHARGGVAWGFTGTPLYNDPPDLWGVLDSLGMAEDVFGRYGTLIYMFRGYETRFGMRWGSPRPEVPALLARYILGRSRAEVLPDLPTKLYQELRVEVNHHEVPPYSVAGGKSPDISRARAVLARAKVRAALPALKEMAARSPLVVFSAHRAAAEEAAAALQVPVAYGGTDVAACVEDFQGGRIPHFVGTVVAAGTGFTLVRSHTVVFIDRDWTPALNEQAEDRVCRIGQTRGVRVVDITCDHPLDQRIRKVLDEKEKIIDASLGALREIEGKDGLRPGY